MSRIRPHLTYANVVATLTLFLVLGGGTALASYVVSSNSQIGPGTISGHKPPSGKHANIIAGSINGTDIADRSGVDTCQTPLLEKLGPICAGSDGVARKFDAAQEYCTNLGLRLPSVSEAVAMAKNYDVPGVANDGSDPFWTDQDYFLDSGGPTGAFYATAVDDLGGVQKTINETAFSLVTVCVTDPSA